MEWPIKMSAAASLSQCSLSRILCGDSCDIWNNLTSPWQEQLADPRRKWIAKCRMQEIIEENESSGPHNMGWIALKSHSAVIMLSWLLYPGCNAMHGPRAHVVTVTMTHVLLSLMSVYLDLTWHWLYLPTCWYQSHHSGSNIVLSSPSAGCHYQG